MSSSASSALLQRKSQLSESTGKEMNGAPRMASSDSVPTLNRALKHSTSSSFFNFFAAGGPEEESVSGAGVEPVEVVEVSSSLSSTLIGCFQWLTILGAISGGDGEC